MMLAQTVFIIALLAIFAASAIAGVAGVARAQSAGVAKALIAPAVETALSRYQRYIAATIAAQIPPAAAAVVTSPGLVPALNGSATWNDGTYLETPAGAAALAVSVDVHPTTETVPLCASPNSGPDIATALQCSPFVQESRLSLAVTSDAGPADANGVVSPLAHGRYTVTLRLFAQPPYAIVSGVKDDADPDGYHEGDTAGYGNALPAFASPSPDDTTIHVVYDCTGGTGSCATSQPPALDAPTATPWTNGNGLP
jgi:hypothetical protein